MTPTEIRALPPGAEVLVRASVESTKDLDDGIVFVRSGKSIFSRAVLASDIECVAPPKPEPLKVGDRIYHREAGPGRLGTIEEIFKGHAIVSGFDGKGGLGFAPVSEYVRASTMDLIRAAGLAYPDTRASAKSAAERVQSAFTRH